MPEITPARPKRTRNRSQPPLLQDTNWSRLVMKCPGSGDRRGACAALAWRKSGTCPPLKSKKNVMFAQNEHALCIRTVKHIALTRQKYIRQKNLWLETWWLRIKKWYFPLTILLNYSWYQDTFANNAESWAAMEHRTKLQSLCETRLVAQKDNTFKCSYATVVESLDDLFLTTAPNCVS